MIEEAIIATRTVTPVTISHVGIEASDEFNPLVAEPHFSRGVKARIIAGMQVSIICAVFILRVSSQYFCMLINLLFVRGCYSAELLLVHI